MTAEPRRIPAPPIHPMAAVVTLVLDNIFNVFEFVDPLLLLFTSMGVGLLGFVSTTLTQRFMARDGWGTSIAKGLVMGIIAGVPYSVTGTAIGAPLLVWAGAHEWIKLPAPRDRLLLEDQHRDPIETSRDAGANRPGSRDK